MHRLATFSHSRLGRWIAALAAVALAILAAQAVTALHGRAVRFAEAQTSIARVRAEVDRPAPRGDVLERELRVLAGLPAGFDPAYDRLASALRDGDAAAAGRAARAADRQAAELAARAASDARLNTLYVFLAAAFVIGLLFWRFRRTQELHRARAAHERAVHETEARFRSLVHHSSDVIAIIDADTTLGYVTPSAGALFGVPADELLGTRIGDRLEPASATALVALGLQPAQDAAATLDFEVTRPDGERRHVEAIATNRLGDPVIRGIVVTMRDVTERRLLERRLEHASLHDALTGLANRVLFEDRVRHALARSVREGREVTVLMLDLDDFKTVNDSLGHGAGDELLRAVAARLDDAVRGSDTVARLGGDEFGILSEEPSTPEAAAALGRRLIDALRAPFTVGEREVFAKVSIGIAGGGAGTADPETLMRDADAAMYVAKTHGKNRVEHFDPQMHATVLKRLELTADLVHAVEREELVIHYQPIVDLGTGRTVDVEALVRWHHPERGLVAPGDFIPIAEESGLIVPIGWWVLREACRQAVSWASAAPGAPAIAVSVNLSGRQLHEADFVDGVAAILAETGLPAARLVLEVTESVLLSDGEAATARLTALRALGVRVAIDDFGTGYSSLSYLRAFPADILKIDRSFIGALAGGSKDAAVVRTVVDLAGTLAMTVVAEGIEHAEQIGILRGLGCDRAQGFLLARPGAAGLVEAMLLEQGRSGTGLLALAPADPG